MNDTLLAFEQHYELGPVAASRVLGVAYVTYAQIRCGDRPMKLYHQRHVQALMLLSQRDRERLVKDYAHV